MSPADQTPAEPVQASDPQLVTTLLDGKKVKRRLLKQRACNEKDEKAKLCGGHLKRWYEYPKEVAALIGPKAEIYRCEFCKTLYRPDPAQQPQSYTLRN